MIKQLQLLVETTSSKQLSSKLKQNKELFAFVQSYFGNTISEKIYNVLHPNLNVCIHNNHKKFVSFQQGYKNCGRASVCQCTRDSVSSSVSKSKQEYSDDKKQEINHKRSQTCLSKYGVANVGQSATAKKAHSDFYNNKHNVNRVTQQIKNTKELRYGNENYVNTEKMKSTWKLRYGIDYWANRYNNENLLTLHNKEDLDQLFQLYSIEDISSKLNVHPQTVYKYLNKHQLRSPFKSLEEEELVKFIQSLGINNIVRNTRTLIPSKKEIDIYLPDFNIAFEYNGVYWHHELIEHIDKNYHYNKFLECQQKDIQLITIFSTFWKSKPNIVKQIIRNKLKLQANSVYARSCNIVLLTSKDIREFLNTNHIQGYTPASIVYGLSYNNELVAVMTFSKPRLGIGKLEDNCYELVRFASSKRVVGGAGKLLKAFERDYLPKKLISYSDNEWSVGKLYQSLNFTLDTNIKPSYWYVKPKEERLIHRFNYSKQKLVKMGFDPNKSEKQITSEIGLLKIWDCGKMKWIKEYK